MKKITLAVLLCASFFSNAHAAPFSSAEAAVQSGHFAGKTLGELPASMAACNWPSEKITQFRAHLVATGEREGARQSVFGTEYTVGFMMGLPEGEEQQRERLTHGLAIPPGQTRAQACKDLEKKVASVSAGVKRMEAVGGAIHR